MFPFTRNLSPWIFNSLKKHTLQPEDDIPFSLYQIVNLIIYQRCFILNPLKVKNNLCHISDVDDLSTF